jgi:hypothetical protein
MKGGVQQYCFNIEIIVQIFILYNMVVEEYNLVF